MSFWDRFRRTNRSDLEPSAPRGIKPSPVPQGVEPSSNEATIPLRRGWLLQPRPASSHHPDLGPAGRGIVFADEAGNPIVTDEGLVVATRVDVKGSYERMSAALLRENAATIRETLGDGSSTFVVLAQAVFRECVNLGTDVDRVALKDGMQRAVEMVVAAIRNATRPITADMIKAIASMSANGDATIGNLVHDAMNHVGKDGVITVEESNMVETELEIVDGMQFERGYLSPHFVTDRDRGVCVLDDPYVLIVGGKLAAKNDVTTIQRLATDAGKPLLIVVDDIDSAALAPLVAANGQDGVRVCAVRTVGFGDRRPALADDLATLTGAARVFRSPPNDATLAELGRARRVIVGKDTTTIVEGASKREDFERRIHQIRAEIEAVRSDYEREKLNERLAALVGGVAVVKMGGVSETDIRRKKERVEQAVCAVRAAVNDGGRPAGWPTAARRFSVAPRQP